MRQLIFLSHNVEFIIGYSCGDSVSSARPAERAFAHLAATNGRSVSSSGPSRMVFDRCTPLPGDCVHYMNV